VYNNEGLRPRLNDAAARDYSRDKFTIRTKQISLRHDLCINSKAMSQATKYKAFGQYVGVALELFPAR